MLHAPRGKKEGKEETRNEGKDMEREGGKERRERERERRGGEKMVAFGEYGEIRPSFTRYTLTGHFPLVLLHLFHFYSFMNTYMNLVH